VPQNAHCALPAHARARIPSPLCARRHRSYPSVTAIIAESKQLQEAQELFELFQSDYIMLQRCSEELLHLKALWDMGGFAVWACALRGCGTMGGCAVWACALQGCKTI